MRVTNGLVKFTPCFKTLNSTGQYVQSSKWGVHYVEGDINCSWTLVTMTSATSTGTADISI